MNKTLSRIKSVNLRDIFPKEDKDFTPWLSKQENLDLLGEVLGMNLELEKREAKVGKFSLDILCKNKNDKSRVAIENQIEKTDHTHLGQLLTYGVGLDAPTMIWIADTFIEEHRQALKWLNKHTPEKFSFFGVKVGARKIDDSNPAIEFTIICHPTDWQDPKTGRVQKKSKGALTPLEDLKQRYWQGLEKYMADNGSKLTGQTPGPWQEQYFNIGRANTGIIVKLHIRENKIRIEIKLFTKKNSKVFFNLLHKDKKAIEKDLGVSLDWQEFPKKAYSSIGVNFNNLNIKDEKDWGLQYIYIKNVVEKFDKVFTHRILALNPSDWKPKVKK